MDNVFDLEETDDLMEKTKGWYVAEICFGNFTSKKSFIAFDENSKEYFADRGIVSKKIEMFRSLSSRKNRFWVLVEDQIWGGKWNNRKVFNIIAIFDQRNFCLVYKMRSVLRGKILLELIDAREANLKLIENHLQDDDFYLKEIEVSDRLDLLKVQLESLDKKLSMMS